MPLQATSGAASYDGFGGGVVAEPNYIESVFSTYLYTGTDANQTITNGIDLSTKGGMVWTKSRSTATNPALVDTVRGANKVLNSDTTDAQGTYADITAFNTTGYSLSAGVSGWFNTSPRTYVSWTFRKQPKFFDVVTYTGNGASSQAITHNLGSTPGCVIVKRTDSTSFWLVWHRGFSSPDVSYGYLNSTDPFQPDSPNNNWAAAPTSTTFTPAANYNVNGATYVAYVFAHNAGGFGLTGTDNVISCGSYTGNGSASGPSITLGYEPQWVLIKNASAADTNWNLFDNMRGMYVGTTGTALLVPNTSNEEFLSGANLISPTATGFNITTTAASMNGNGNTLIYIAIRRGPMKVPTSGTSVFGLNARTGTGANATVTGSAGVSDAVLIKNRGSAVASLFSSRLTGVNYLVTSTIAAQVAAGATILQANPWDVMDGVKVGTTSTITNASANTYINYLFKRAPSFMDVVFYTGNYTGGGTLFQTLNHNLAKVPELMIVKMRSSIKAWAVYYGDTSKYIELQSTAAAQAADGRWYSTSPTSTQFTVGNDSDTNLLGETFVNYLFATCAGVSKVGSYTGNGTSQTINCGFTGGARFVLIKRTDSTGDWMVSDSARGIVSGNDPYLELNNTNAEVTGEDWLDTDSTGFVVNEVSGSNANTNGATYIFLAIA